MASTRKSTRQKKLSKRALQNEIHGSLGKIRAYIRRFNKLVLSCDSETTALIDLENLAIDAKAEVNMLHELCGPCDTPVELEDLELQVNTMMKQCKDKKTEAYDTQSKISKTSKSKSNKSSSRASFRSIKSKLELAEINIELESLKKRSALEQQMAQIQLELSQLKLHEKQQALQAQQNLLEEQELSDREDLLEYLETEQRSKLPNKVTITKKPATVISETPSDQACSNQELAVCITKAIQANNVPKPPVFRGNPLEFRDWKLSFIKYVNDKMITEDHKMITLKEHVAGAALEAISGLCRLHTPDAYNEALELLTDRYGNEYTVAQEFKTKLNDWPKIKANDAKTLRSFSDYLAHCNIAKKELQDLSILNEADKISELASKLPNNLNDKWKRKAAKYRQNHTKYPSFSKFVEFVKEEADILNDPIVCKQSTSAPPNPSNNKEIKQKSQSFNTQQQHHKIPSCLFCETNTHRTIECRSLSVLPQHEKEDFVMECQLCFKCLKGGHQLKACRAEVTCSKCHMSHPTALHREPPRTKIVNNPPSQNSKEKPQATTMEIQSGTSSLCSMIVPVWLSTAANPTHEILVYALLDSMSDTSFVTEKATKDLNACGVQTTLDLTTMTDKSTNIKCMFYDDLVVRGYNDNNRLNLSRTFSKDYIPLNKSHVPTKHIANNWPHFSSIADELPHITHDIDVGLLIGYDNSKAQVPLEVIKGNDIDEPYAMKTPLGWCIVGKTGLTHEKSSDAHICNRVSSAAIEEILPAQVLDVLEQDFNENNLKCNAMSETMSQNDVKFMNIMNQETKQGSDGHYYMPLPFKSRPSLPNNKSYTANRLASLKKKLLSNEKLKSDYFNFMNDIIAKGDAEPASNTDSCRGEQWYIPHFGVYHPKKPNKIRVVFDCSAKCHNTSLNDHLLQGPDLMNRLVGVLHRFRKEPVAVMCDIERMFHMFKVHSSDRNYLKFLWFTDETMTNIKEYRMTVHLFGATSSPACATYGLRKIANDQHDACNEYSIRAVNFIVHNFYVDDGLTSFETSDEAVAVIKETVDICAKGNVRLHKFISNSPDVIKALPTTELSEVVKDLDLQAATATQPTERALGVQWCFKTDEFTFKCNIKDQPVTRRGILSIVASVFDPLGFLSPVILVGKNILQKTCKAHWDDPLEPQLEHEWQAWRKDLDMIESVRIPRCTKPSNLGTIVKTELHHFSDASNKGLGQCSYLRLVDVNNKVHCTLLSAKSRVAPTKSVTVPRAELQAAVLSIKLSKLVKAELNIDSLDEYFWCDSKVVLGYIQNSDRRFHIYVANRVQTIIEHSKSTQWHYVSTSDNPADLASRGANVSKLVASHWFEGPAFLWQADLSSMLNDSIEYTILENDPEIKTQSTCLNTITDITTNLVAHLSKYSDLNSMIKGISSLKRLIRNRRSNALLPMSVTDLEEAKLVVIKWYQQVLFSHEYTQLKQGKTVSKQSNLFKVDPFLDTEGVMRVGGRLRNSNLSFDETHPIIIPKNSHLAKLIIKQCHEKVKHQGKGITICEIKSSGYHIVGVTNQVTSYINKCITCRKQRYPTMQQKMADLPSDRAASTAPFTYIGCDLFGPFIVKDRRTEVKRYGLIVTCMASRAIHIEMVSDMTTDSLINALRRFIAVRGPVRQIRCDNGSNLIGMMNEFKDNSTLQAFAIDNNIDFVLNPPQASHMGGIWERQIRTIRNVLNVMLAAHKTRLDSDTFSTFLSEVMAIVNGRPLNTLDDNSMPLTPNQILTMKSKIVPPPPGEFDEDDTYSRKRWRQAQGLANEFWSKWKDQYLLNQQQRQKWQQPQRNIQLNDIVLVKNELTHRNNWPMAKVIEVIPSADNLIRKCKVQVATAALDVKGKRLTPPTVLTRPVRKLVYLFST